MAGFVLQLRHLSKHCEFGDKLDHMLRDKIVCGINDVRMQECLLPEPSITSAKVLELALVLETADNTYLEGSQQN